jgi:hypothetical protein
MNLFGDLLFDYDKATLKPAAEEALKRVAAVVSQFPGNVVARTTIQWQTHSFWPYVAHYRVQIRAFYCEQVSTETVKTLGPINPDRINRNRTLLDSIMPDETSEPNPPGKKRALPVRDLKPKTDPKGGAAHGGKSDKTTPRTEEVDFDWTLHS